MPPTSRCSPSTSISQRGSFQHNEKTVCCWSKESFNLWCRCGPQRPPITWLFHCFESVTRWACGGIKARKHGVKACSHVPFEVPIKRMGIPFNSTGISQEKFSQDCATITAFLHAIILTERERDENSSPEIQPTKSYLRRKKYWGWKRVSSKWFSFQRLQILHCLQRN